MLNNLDMNLVKNALTRNLKAKFETAPEETLSINNPNRPAKPETGRGAARQPILAVWSNNTNPGKSEQR